jgi:hypothetical protein
MVAQVAATEPHIDAMVGTKDEVDGEFYDGVACHKDQAECRIGSTS